MLTPLARNFQSAFLRWTSRYGSGFREIDDRVVPVVVVGEDRADSERLIIANGAVVPAVAARFGAASLDAETGDLELFIAWASRQGGAFNCLIRTELLTVATVLPVAPLIGIQPGLAPQGVVRAGTVAATTAGLSFSIVGAGASEFPVLAGLIVKAGTRVVLECDNANATATFAFAWRNL
jgi:hypothetical protein